MSDRNQTIPCAFCGKNTGSNSVSVAEHIYCDSNCRDSCINRRIVLAEGSSTCRRLFVARLRGAMSADRDFFGRLSENVRNGLTESGLLALIFAQPISHVRGSAFSEQFERVR